MCCLLAGLIVTMALLASQPATREAVIDRGPWRYLLAVIPVIPVVYAMIIFSRAVRELDELQRRIQLEAFAFSLGGTGLLTFGYGYLEYAGLPHINPIFVLPLMAALWGVGVTLAARRYR